MASSNKNIRVMVPSTKASRRSGAFARGTKIAEANYERMLIRKGKKGSNKSSSKSSSKSSKSTTPIRNSVEYKSDGNWRGSREGERQPRKGGMFDVRRGGGFGGKVEDSSGGNWRNKESSEESKIPPMEISKKSPSAPVGAHEPLGSSEESLIPPMEISKKSPSEAGYPASHEPFGSSEGGSCSSRIPPMEISKKSPSEAGLSDNYRRIYTVSIKTRDDHAIYKIWARNDDEMSKYFDEAKTELFSIKDLRGKTITNIMKSEGWRYKLTLKWNNEKENKNGKMGDWDLVGRGGNRNFSRNRENGSNGGRWNNEDVGRQQPNERWRGASMRSRGGRFDGLGKNSNRFDSNPSPFPSDRETKKSANKKEYNDSDSIKEFPSLTIIYKGDTNQDVLGEVPSDGRAVTISDKGSWNKNLVMKEEESGDGANETMRDDWESLVDEGSGEGNEDVKMVSLSKSLLKKKKEKTVVLTGWDD